MGFKREADDPRHCRGNENKSFGRTPMWFSTASRVPRILHACAASAILVTFTAGAQAQSEADNYAVKPI